MNFNEFKGFVKKYWYTYIVFIWVVNTIIGGYNSTRYAIGNKRVKSSYNVQKEEKKEVIHTFEEYKKENKLGTPFFEVENHKVYIIKNDINSIDNIPLKLLYVNTDIESQDMEFGIRGFVTNDYSDINESGNQYYWIKHKSNSKCDLMLKSDKQDNYSFSSLSKKEIYEYKTENIGLVWNNSVPEKSEIYLIAKINGRTWELPAITLE